MKWQIRPRYAIIMKRLSPEKGLAFGIESDHSLVVSFRWRYPKGSLLVESREIL